MRILLTMLYMLLVFPGGISAQNQFKRLDQLTYDYFQKGDLKNLKLTADTILSQGTDYYYLRMRLGILSYNKQLYSNAFIHFKRALEFNSKDTISPEYIYFSYIFSGRIADADLYLRSLPSFRKNITLTSAGKQASSNFYIGTSFMGSDYITYTTNSLYYEALKNSLSLNAGYETSFLHRFKGTVAYTNFRKSGKVYSRANPSGTDLNFSQNEIYVKLTGYLFPGWEISAFGHFAFIKDINTPDGKNSDLLGGVGFSKNGWKIRTGMNMSLSNFSNSAQIRSEGYLTWLPSGNLNLYLTSGGMYQSDINWGATYRFNQEIGFKVSGSIWLESGIVRGNSFLSAGNLGYNINNSYQIPVTTIYSNIIILPVQHLSITITPFYGGYQNYSWDLTAYTRTNKLTINSFGVFIKINYKTR
jgi:hypothetical protein